MDKKILGYSPKYFTKLYITGFTAWYLIIQTILTLNYLITGGKLEATIKPSIIIAFTLTTINMILYKLQTRRIKQ